MTFRQEDSLLQLRVLRLGLVQDGDVGVGVFPEVKTSLRQPHPAQQVGEARVGADAVVNGITL